MTHQELAAQYLEYFTYNTRDNGEKFVKTEDNIPVELFDLIKTAHGDMMPDDYRYQFIYEALNIISETDDIEDAYQNVEADIYYHDVFKWLASRNDRIGYCDQYVEEYGGFELDGSNAFILIQSEQYLEKMEVFESVKSSLESICEVMNEEGYEELEI